MSTRRRARALVLLLAGSGCAAPQSPPQGLLPPLPGPANGRVAISGRVDDATTGRPLADVTISIHRVGAFDSFRTLTAADGTYFVGDLPPGHYSVHVWSRDELLTRKFTAPPGARFAASFAVDTRGLRHVSDDVRRCSQQSKWWPHCRGATSDRVRVTHIE